MKKLTDKQRQAIGEVMADHFGAHIQSGWVNNSVQDLAYVCWQTNGMQPPKYAYVDPEGTVSYDNG